MDLFTELIKTHVQELDEHAKYAAEHGPMGSHSVFIPATYPALSKLMQIADDATIQRCVNEYRGTL